MDNISFLIFQLAVLLASVVIHEVSHGLMALRLGDETAKLAGRLTLNPIKHLDWLGSFFVPLTLMVVGSPFLLGWAKPVPYNPMFLHKDYRFGPLKVALAGPASNIIIALIASIAVRAGELFLDPVTLGLLGFIVFLNIFLAVFNLMPIPPLDGSKILTTFLPPHYANALERIGLVGIILVFAFLFIFLGPIQTLSSTVFYALVGPSGVSHFANLF